MILALLLAVSLSAGSAELEEAARQGALEVTLAQLRTRFAAEPSFTGRLEKAMLANPADYRVRTNAFARGRALYAEALAQAWSRETSAVRTRLGVSAARDALPEQTRAKCLAEYPALFAAARASACQKQARSIGGAICPTVEELETRDTAELARTIGTRLAARQKTPVFEENVEYISDKIVRPIIQAGYAERKRQAGVLANLPSSAYAPEKLSAALEAGLTADVAAHRTRKGAKAAYGWGVFPSVLTNDLPATVRKRTQARLGAEIDSVEVVFPDEEIVELFRGNPRAHRHAEDSWKLVRSAYEKRLKACALARVGTAAPAEERASFLAYARACPMTKAQTRQIESRAAREFEPRWKRVRRETARQAACAIWPRLADGTWYPDAAFADDIAARTDFAKTVRNWRTEPALQSFARAEAQAVVLDETAQDGDVAIERALKGACAAVRMQHTLVDQAAPGVLAEAQVRRDSFWRRTPDFKALCALLTEAVETRWLAVRDETLWGRGARPANADEQHRDLFPSVRRHIELVAKSIVEQLEPSEPPPEDNAGISIVVRRHAGKIGISLKKGKESLSEHETPSDMEHFRSAMKDVTEKLGRDVLDL